MTADEFLLCWERAFPECRLLAMDLELYEDRWFRIHTLPNSKRWPENESETAEILRRHNTILMDIFGNERPIIVLTAGYSESKSPVRPEHELKSMQIGNQYWMTFQPHFTDCYWHFYMNEQVWRTQSLDELLRLVAYDTVANVFLVDVENRRLYHPYDGGGDVVVEDVRTRDELRAKYSSWLPKM